MCVRPHKRNTVFVFDGNRKKKYLEPNGVSSFSLTCDAWTHLDVKAVYELQESYEIHHATFYGRGVIVVLHTPSLVLMVVVERGLDSLGRSGGDVLVDCCAGPQHLLHRRPGRQTAGGQQQPRVAVGAAFVSASGSSTGTVVVLVLENKLREGLFELVRL